MGEPQGKVTPTLTRKALEQFKNEYGPALRDAVQEVLDDSESVLRLAGILDEVFAKHAVGPYKAA